jgi:trimethylamine--corrinoid protein Co-methyltransferase
MDVDTRKLLKDNGCRESDDGYILLEEGLVQQALSTVPEQVILYDRNGEPVVDTDDAVPRFSPGLGAIHFLDYETGKHRPCLLADISKVAHVCEQLPNIDMAASLGNPSDVHPREEALAAVRALIEKTRKPIAFTAHDEIEISRIWQYLADVSGSRESFAAKPFAMDLTGPTSPLHLGEEACKRLRMAAKYRFPVVCYPALLPGATGPITMAGAIAHSSAEILAGIVVHQLENPGAPVITGSAILPMDMRAATITYGSPEYALVGLAAIDYFSDLGVPTWVGAGCSDAHTLDAQAAAEAGANIFAAVLTGTSFVHNLGYLSAGKTGSLEMLVLCDELAGMARRFSAGIQVDSDTLAVDVIQRASKECTFMKDRHTAKHLRSEMWIPSMFQRTYPGEWQDDGSTTMQQRIREKLKDLLSSFG